MVFYADIVEEHGEEAAFLWEQRCRAVDSPEYSLQDLGELEERLEAHLDGLRVAGDQGWDQCLAQLGDGFGGEYFVAAVLALESRRADRRDTLLDAVGDNPDQVRAVVSAVGWVSERDATEALDPWAADDRPAGRAIAMGGIAVRRMQTSPLLAAGLSDDHPQVRARALRACGELGRPDLLNVLRREWHGDSRACAFWSAWSAVLLGDDEGIPVLESLALQDPLYEERVLDLIPRVFSLERVCQWVRETLERNGQLRACMRSVASHGAALHLPWLVEQSADPDLSRLAGHAFSVITGLDLARHGLVREAPEPVDDDAGDDPDEDLPWPDHQRLALWWDQHKGAFDSEQRYLAGERLDDTRLRGLLESGRQSIRRAAALELALRNRGRQALFETRASARSQRATL